jgi:hypothetical protein
MNSRMAYPTGQCSRTFSMLRSKAAPSAGVSDTGLERRALVPRGVDAMLEDYRRGYDKNSGLRRRCGPADLALKQA